MTLKFEATPEGIKLSSEGVITKAVASADGKTLTVTQTGTDAQGKVVSTTAVYEKQ